MTSERLTSEQFAALAQLLRLRGGQTQEAVRLVLVEGLPAGEAATRVGISGQGVHNALVSCRRGIRLARVVAGPSGGPSCQPWAPRSAPG